MAVETVKDSLDCKQVESVTNFENPIIEEVIWETKPSICYFDDVDVIGEKLYKITFHTLQDSLLGPLIFYVRQSDGILIGTEYRE